MNKLQAALTAVFLKMGLPQTEIDKMFPADDTKEGTVDETVILKQAQEYAKPLLKDHFEVELKGDFKGKYLNEAVHAIAAASGGLLKREDVTGKPVADVMAMLKTKQQEQSGTKDSDKDTLIADLNKKLGEKDTELATKLETQKAHYEGIEGKRNIGTYVAAALKGKDITVGTDKAASTIVRELEEKYILKWEDGKVAFYDKANPEQRVKNTAGLNFMDVTDHVDTILQENAWDKKSNGGAGGGAGAGAGATNPLLAGQMKDAAGNVDTKSVSPLVLAAAAAGMMPGGNQ